MTLHPIPKQHSERIVIETQTERKWELRTKMIFNHDIFLIYFSNFNIDIDVSRTSLEIEPPRLPFRWNGEKILPSQPTLHSGEGFLCNIWGHSFIVLIICLFLVKEQLNFCPQFSHSTRFSCSIFLCDIICLFVQKFLSHWSHFSVFFSLCLVRV